MPDVLTLPSRRAYDPTTQPGLFGRAAPASDLSPDAGVEMFGRDTIYKERMRERQEKTRQSALDRHLQQFQDDPVAKLLGEAEFDRLEEETAQKALQKRLDDIQAEHNDPVAKILAVGRAMKSQSQPQVRARQAEVDAIEQMRETDTEQRAIEQTLPKNAFVREVVTGSAAASQNMASLLARMVGQGEAADEINRQMQTFEAGREQARENDLSPYLSRQFGGAVKNVVGMAAVPGGAGVKIGQAFLQAGNQALTTAEDAGLKGPARLRYAATQALLEGGIAAVSQKLFGPGMESRLAGQAVAAQTWKQLAKNLGTDGLKEALEEIPTSVLQDLSSKLEGVSPDMGIEDFVSHATDAAVQAVMMSSMSNAPNAGKIGLKVLGLGRSQQGRIDDFLGNPLSERLYRKAVGAGMPPIPAPLNANRENRAAHAEAIKQAMTAAQQQQSEPEPQTDAKGVIRDEEAEEGGQVGGQVLTDGASQSAAGAGVGSYKASPSRTAFNGLPEDIQQEGDGAGQSGRKQLADDLSNTPTSGSGVIADGQVEKVSEVPSDFDSWLNNYGTTEQATDERTGLPLNPDGTVTLFHHTNQASADRIRQSGVLESEAEPDVYLTTESTPNTGYGEVVVPVNVDPGILQLDDEFPSGRRDFRMPVGRPGGSTQIRQPAAATGGTVAQPAQTPPAPAAASENDPKIEEQLREYRRQGVPEDRIPKIRETLYAKKRENEEGAKRVADTPERRAVNRDVFTDLVKQFGAPDRADRSEAAYFRTPDGVTIRMASHVPIHSRSDRHITIVQHGADHQSWYHPDTTIISTYNKTAPEVLSEVTQAIEAWKTKFASAKQSPASETPPAVSGEQDVSQSGVPAAGAEDYRMQHRPNSEGPQAHDLLSTDLAPRDIYDRPDFYTGEPGSVAYKESVAALRKIRGKPDAEITVYRASPQNTLNEGDWVSFSKSYSKQHGMADNPSDDVPVHAFKVKARDVRWAGDTLEEFGYYPVKATPSVDAGPAPAAASETPLTPQEKVQAIAKTATERGWSRKNMTKAAQDAGVAPGAVHAAAAKMAQQGQRKDEYRSRKTTLEKPDRNTITDDAEITANQQAAHDELTQAGAVLKTESPSGSRYYEMPNGQQVRVADHEPNAATDNWIGKNAVDEIRVDRKGWRQSLDSVLESPPPSVAAQPSPAVEQSASGVPGATLQKDYSVDSLKDAFDLSDEQAAATDALVQSIGLDTSKIKVAKGGTAGEGALFQPAYHGSPHTFDKFSTKKIGTGEGAQAYGWGLYFAGNKAVAKYYKEKLSQRFKVKTDKEAIALEKRINERLRIHSIGYTDKPPHIQRLADFRDLLESADPTTKKIADSVKQVLIEDGTWSEGRGYEVDLKPDDEDYLNWDKPLSEQSEKVQQALGHDSRKARREAAEVKVDFYLLQAIQKDIDKFVDLPAGEGGFTRAGFEKLSSERSEFIDRLEKNNARVQKTSSGWDLYYKPRETTGEDVYRGFEKEHSLNESTGRRDKAGASNHLKSLGIRGIKYLDQSSRSKGEGSHNYVIFDEADVEIKELFQGGKGSTEFIDGGKALLRGLESPDISTAIHEVAHVARRTLLNRDVPVENRAGITDADIKIAENWSGAANGNWTVRAEEKFARGLERHLRDNTSITGPMGKVFEKIASWLKGIYKTIKGSPLDIKISKPMRELFDKIINRTTTLQKAGAIPSDAAGVQAEPPASKVKFHYGKPTTIVAEGMAPIPAHFAAVELDELQPSHNFGDGYPVTNPNYKASRQPRDYSPTSDNADKVRRHASPNGDQKYDPRFALSDAADAADGSPSVTTAGEVINGNGRVMTEQLVEFQAKEGSHYGPAEYKRQFGHVAAHFGIDPAVVAAGKNMKLVRVVDLTPEQEAKFAEAGNYSQTQAQSPAETAKKISALLTSDVIAKLDTNGTTFGEAVNGDSKAANDFRTAFYNAVPASQRATYFSPDGSLTEAGKELVRHTALQRIVDAKTYDRMTPQQQKLIDTAIPQLLQLRKTHPEADVGPALVEAIKFINENKIKDKADVADRVATVSMFAGEVKLSPAGQMMSEFVLDSAEKSTSLREASKRLLSDLGVVGRDMFGEEDGRTVPEKVADSFKVKARPGADFSNKGARDEASANQPSGRGNEAAADKAQAGVGSQESPIVAKVNEEVSAAIDDAQKVHDQIASPVVASELQIAINAAVSDQAAVLQNVAKSSPSQEAEGPQDDIEREILAGLMAGLAPAQPAETKESKSPRQRSQVGQALQATGEKLDAQQAVAVDEVKAAFRDLGLMRAINDPKAEADRQIRATKAVVNLGVIAAKRGIVKFSDFVTFAVEQLNDATVRAASTYITKAWKMLKLVPGYENIDTPGSVADILDAKKQSPPESSEPKVLSDFESGRAAGDKVLQWLSEQERAGEKIGRYANSLAHIDSINQDDEIENTVREMIRKSFGDADAKIPLSFETEKWSDFVNGFRKAVEGRLESDAPIKLESVPKAAVTVGNWDEIKSGDHDLRLAISKAANHYTLWYQIPVQPGRPIAPWRYVRILGGNKTEAHERAKQAADRIAVGDLTGLAFIGKEQIALPKSIGLINHELGPEQLMAAERAPIGEQPVGFGKYRDTLVKDLFAKDPGYAQWLADSGSSGRGKQVAEYLSNHPDLIASRDADIAATQDAMTPESIEILKGHGITPEALSRGGIALRGKTYDWKDFIKSLGGKFSDGSWIVSADQYGTVVGKLGGIAKPVGGQRGGVPAHQSNPAIGELRRNADARPDTSEFIGPVSEYISDETSALIGRGRSIGMPEVVVNEQIEDVARINRAYQQGKPLFLLASEPGSGKTFVLGGAIRELQAAGAKKIVYVTLRSELIAQIKNDLKDYGIEGVEFVTYPAMRELQPSETDVLIFDEAHSIKNVGKGDEGAQQAAKAAEWINQSKFTVLSTATPFENPVQAQYLQAAGVFEADFKDFKSFALAYGASTYTLKSGDDVMVWKRTASSDRDAAAAREYFRKEGIFTSRRIRLPDQQVDSRLVKVNVDPKAAETYAAFSAAAAENQDSLAGFGAAWIVNFQKRLLEAAKVQHGITEAKAALKRGRFPIIFVETKAERKIDIPELIEAKALWEMAVAESQKMGDKPPSRGEFGVPPPGVVETLASFMDSTGTSRIEIPSAEDIIKEHFGEAKVAIFTGSVTPTKAQKNLDAWRRGEKPVLVATMAKGGTGLSLHDKVGDHQTTQININLPWTATQVVQVAQRSARYGLKGQAEMQWIFADNIPFDRNLSNKVGGRMADMGAVVHGERLKDADKIEDWDFENKPFSAEPAAEPRSSAKEPVEKEPWQMTANDWHKTNEGRSKLDAATSQVRADDERQFLSGRGKPKDAIERRMLDAALKKRRDNPLNDFSQFRAELIAGHMASVRTALAEGKPVPAEVLAEYPDLKEPSNAVPAQSQQAEQKPAVQADRSGTGTQDADRPSGPENRDQAGEDELAGLPDIVRAQVAGIDELLAAGEAMLESGERDGEPLTKPEITDIKRAMTATKKQRQRVIAEAGSQEPEGRVRPSVAKPVVITDANRDAAKDFKQRLADDATRKEILRSLRPLKYGRLVITGEEQLSNLEAVLFDPQRLAERPSATYDSTKPFIPWAIAQAKLISQPSGTERAHQAESLDENADLSVKEAWAKALRSLGNDARGINSILSGPPISDESFKALKEATAITIRDGARTFRAYVKAVSEALGGTIPDGIKSRMVSLWNDIGKQFPAMKLDTATDAMLTVALDGKRNAEQASDKVGTKSGQSSDSGFGEAPVAIEEPSGDGSDSYSIKRRKVDEFHEKHSWDDVRKPEIPTLEAAQVQADELAKETMKSDANYGYDLMNRLLNDPLNASVSRLDVAVMQRLAAEAQVNYETAIEKLQEAKARDADDKQIADLNRNAEDLHEKAKQIHDVGAIVSRTWHGVGMQLQAEFDRELNRLDMEREWSLADEGRPLDDEGKEQLKRIAAEAKRLKAENARLAKELEESNVEAAAQKAHADAVRDVLKAEQERRKALEEELAREKAKPQGGTSGSKPTVTRQPKARQNTQDAIARLRAKARELTFRKSVEFIPYSRYVELAPELIDVARAYISEKVATFQDFMDRLKADAADMAKQYADDWKAVWDGTKLSDITANIADEYDSENAATLTPIARELHRFVIERDGLKTTPADRKRAVHEVQGILKPFIPDITITDTAKAMSGYDIYHPLNNSRTEVVRREQNAQLGILLNIGEIWRTGHAKSRGVERTPSSDEQRELGKVRNQAKKRHGKPTDEEKAGQLKSTLASMKTSLRNRIKDLEKEIAAHKRKIKTPATSPTDTELQDLLKQLAEVQALHEETFGKRKLTDQQRQAILEKGLDRRYEELVALRESGKLWPPNGNPSVKTTPAIEAKRARNAAELAAIEELRLHTPEHAARALAEREKGLERKIEKVKADLEADKLSRPESGETAPTSVTTRALQEQLETLQDELDYRRKNSPEFQLREEAKIVRQQLKRIAAWKERIANEDFGPRPPKPQRVRTEAMKKNDIELEKLREEFAKGKRDRWLKNRHPMKKLLDRAVLHPASIIRKVLTSVDASLIGRQGWFAWVTHPILTAKAARQGFTRDMSKSWSIFPSADEYRETVTAIKNDPVLVDIAKRTGINLTEISGGLNREEGFQEVPDWVNKVPGLGGSERSASAFMDTLRTSLAVHLVTRLAQKREANGEPALTRAEMRVIGHFVNGMTGRQSLSQKADSSKWLANIFFSARWKASRMLWPAAGSVWLYENRWLGTGEGVGSDVRKAMLGEWVKQVAGVGTVMGITAATLALAYGAGGPDKEWEFVSDENSPKFGQFRIGDVWIDFTTGVGALISFPFRVVRGKKKGKWRTETIDRDRETFKFFQGNLAPVPSMMADPIYGTMDGTEFGSKEWFVNRLTPLIAQDVYDLSNKNNIPASAVWDTAVFLGAGVKPDRPNVRERADAADTLRSLRERARQSSSPARRAELEQRAKSLLHDHLKSAAVKELKSDLSSAKDEAATKAIMERIKEVKASSPTTPMSQALAADFEKEKHDIAIWAATRLSSEPGKDEKSDRSDTGIKAARDLLLEVEPDFEKARELFNSAKKAKKEDTLSPAARSARSRLRAFYESKNR